MKDFYTINCHLQFPEKTYFLIEEKEIGIIQTDEFGLIEIGIGSLVSEVAGVSENTTVPTKALRTIRKFLEDHKIKKAEEKSMEPTKHEVDVSVISK